MVTATVLLSSPPTARTGLRAATGKGRILLRPSCIGGIDLSGTVTASSDPRFAKGDAVLAVGHELGVKHHGGYAEYARIPANWAVKLPKGLTLW